MTRTLAMVTLAAAALVAAMATSVDAKPKVALTAIDGDDSGKIGDAVVEALDGDELTVISQRTVNKAVDKLGLDADMSEKQAKKLSGEVDADAIAIGKLGKAGGNRTLHFTLYIHGKKARGFTVTFNNPKSDRFRAKLRDKMVTKIQDETGGGGGGGEEEATEKPGKKKKGGGGEATEGDEEDPLGGKGKKDGKKKVV